MCGALFHDFTNADIRPHDSGTPLSLFHGGARRSREVKRFGRGHVVKGGGCYPTSEDDLVSLTSALVIRASRPHPIPWPFSLV